MDLKIERIEKLCTNPEAVDIGLEGLFHLKRVGLLDESCTGLGYNYPAILARLDGWVAGILIYQEQDWNAQLFVSEGFVRSDFRQRGVYRALWNELLAVAREKGWYRISGVTHVNNDEMQAVMKKLGRELMWLTYEYRLPKKS